MLKTTASISTTSILSTTSPVPTSTCSKNPSYSFEAQPNDYASRFKLVFNPSDPTGEIGDGFVEGKSVVIDMTGRVVATKANTQLAPGVYILRTVDGNETHSQKIIIK